MLALLPLSLEELRPACAANALEACVISGYPRLYVPGLDATIWLEHSITTCVERDARSVLNVGKLNTLQAILGMCAARAGQLLNNSALAPTRV